MSDNIKYTIYSLPENYKISKADYEKVSFTGTIDEVLKKLRKNKGWHIRINPDKDCIAFGDFDHTTKESFKEFLNVLCKKFGVTLDQISYTKSKKENEYSYHWSIPLLETNPKFLYNLFKKSEMFNKYVKSKEIDLSVYTEKFLRLPEQTNEEKSLAHRIMRGEMKHFIVEYSNDSIFECFDEETENKVDEEDEDEEEEDEKELDIEKVNTYLELLDSDIDYNDWLSVGMALKNEGYDFEIWDSWSSTGSKYNKSEMKNKWKSFQKNDLSINKIISLVKDYNIEGYNELQQEKIPEFIDKPEDLKPEPKVDPFFLKSISGLESDIANYIIYKYLKNKYVCVSCDDKTFYYYNKNRWVEDIENITIFKYISVNYVNELIDFETDDIKGKNNIIKKLKGKISGINGIIDWICKELFNPKFYDLCDNNIYLLGFDNGVYDTRTKTFREGEPTDYITKSVGYNFPVEEKGYTKDIKHFLKKVFPDKEVRDYILQQQAQALSGAKSEDCVYTHTGRGGNGKSIEQQILKNVYGDYYLEIPSSMLTKVNKMEHNKPDPFYSELKGVRYSTANEPSDGAKINDSLIKIMGSKEGMKYRTLFSNKVEKLLLQTQLHIYCNNKLDFNANDGGLVRRLKVIDYVSKFVGDDKKHLINDENNVYEGDVELSEKVNLWAPDYMKMLIELYNPKYKYTEPEAVKCSSNKYVDANNDLKKFVEEHYEFTNNKTDILFLKDIKFEYQNNKEYDQSKVKNLKELLEKEMNTTIIEKTKIKKGDKHIDVRSVIRGWRVKQENNNDSFVDDPESDNEQDI